MEQPLPTSRQEYWTWVSLHMGICLAILAAEILRVPAGSLCSSIYACCLLMLVASFHIDALQFPKIGALEQLFDHMDW